ncbi:MAG: serine/threonine-protein phosphatase, partial [Proteobacteria bacterium]|nr:serine/threonine-protein phosphatase [Pseudomonadota bacterium]
VVDLDATRTFARIWNAGLPEALLISQTGEIKQRFKSNHLPLGIMEYGIDEIQSDDIRLECGDTIYVYSDGVTEAENEKGEMLGEDGFEALLSVATDENGRLMDVRNKIASFVGKAAPTDDISIIEIKTLVTRDDITLES